MDENLKYYRQITENGGGIPAEMLISQQPKAIESRNWYQIIAMTIFYNHVMIYINMLTFFFTQIFKKPKDIRV